MFQKFKKHCLLILILLVASGLRLYALDRGDAISDEVLYGFRAIGMLDFDFAVAQPTTWQLFHGTVPTWARLSFHDHPPLVFLVQHWFMQVFGANLWGMRLPSALFGIGSLLCIYVIGKKLFTRKAGIIAAALMAVNVLMVYVSRTGVQESQVIFFTLLTVYFFLKALDNSRYWFAVGTALGLGLLSKYTAGFVVLPLLAYVLFFRRDVFKQWQAYAAAGIAFLIFSPVIIYNIMLYRTFGHFDFQLFYMFGQKVSYWQVTPGKEIGSITQRFTDIFGNLLVYHSNVLNIFAAVAVAWCVARLARFRKLTDDLRNSFAFVLMLVIGIVLLFLAIGPSPRFLSMLIPWLLLLVAALCVTIFEFVTNRMIKHALIIFFVTLIGWETFFSFNSYIAYQPVGAEARQYSRIHWDMHPWGFNELDSMIRKTIDGKYPTRTIPYTHPFLEEVKTEAIRRAKDAGKASASYLFVYDDSQSDLATLWVINRHSLYEAWPMIAAENFQEAIQENGKQFYEEHGFTDLFFMRATSAVLPNQRAASLEASEQTEQVFKNKGAELTSLYNHAGEEVFRWYHIRAQ